MNELHLKINVEGAQANQIMNSLSDALSQAFPEESATITPKDANPGAIRARSGAIAVLELLVTIGLHAMLLQEMHQLKQEMRGVPPTETEAFSFVKELLGALAKAGVPVDKVSIELNGIFQPLSELATKLGIVKRVKLDKGDGS